MQKSMYHFVENSTLCLIIVKTIAISPVRSNPMFKIDFRSLFEFYFTLCEFVSSETETLNFTFLKKTFL